MASPARYTVQARIEAVRTAIEGLEKAERGEYSILAVQDNSVEGGRGAPIK
jgi:hypothetical protein